MPTHILLSAQAMIFYMKLPDGNLDDLSQHAAMPVIEGEKWFGKLLILLVFSCFHADVCGASCGR
jgi:hypothetical protein